MTKLIRQLIKIFQRNRTLNYTMLDSYSDHVVVVVKEEILFCYLIHSGIIKRVNYWVIIDDSVFGTTKQYWDI